jgi:hypothetical protein
MNTRFHFALFLLAALSFACPHAARAADSTDGCSGFIASLPATIASQGIWCLNQDLSTAITSGNAITINTNNVTIDCNHYKLDGSAAGAGTNTFGIYANSRTKVTVRRCAISGFYVGAKLTGNAHLVDGNAFVGNTQIGLVIDAAVNKSDSLVRDNRVLATGGSTLTATVYGIYAHQAVDLIDNTVVAVSARSGSNGNAYGIYTTGTAHGATLRGNRVEKINKDGSGHAYGIYNDTSNHLILRDNDVSSPGDVGIYCSNGFSVMRDNVIHDFTTAVSSCSDGGGNFHTP